MMIDGHSVFLSENEDQKVLRSLIHDLQNKMRLRNIRLVPVLDSLEIRAMEISFLLKSVEN